MTKYRKKPVVIEATRWFKNGDHPADFRRPDLDGEAICRHCRVRMHEHGWIDTKEGGRIVCPGDWVITGVQGERYLCKPDIFEATYDPA